MLLATAFFLYSAVVVPCAPRAETVSEPHGAPVMQPRAHSHNDYLHPRPLLEAEGLVDRDGPVDVRDPVAGVDELHACDPPLVSGD